MPAHLINLTCLGLATMFFASPARGQASAQNPPEKVPGKSAIESEGFFKLEKVHRIDISVLPAPGVVKPLAPLIAEPRKYVMATVTEGENVYPDVGIHLRGGLGSFRPVTEKCGFTINMDKFEATKNFHGMEKWHLANSAQDGSYLSEYICNEMLRAAGVPSPRVTHAIVSLNGMSKGFYVLKEGYDAHFLKRYFQNADGNFYDGGFLRDIDQPIELVRTKKDVKDWADLKALVAAVREPDPQKRFELLEKLLDMDVFISGFCIQAILGDWDGYVFNRNNYRIYHDPKRDKIVFLPSGLDQEFGNADQGPLVPPMKGMVAIAVFNTPEGKARYMKRMDEINKAIMDPVKWNKRLDELQARLQPEIAKVDSKAGADYPNQLKRIRDFFNIRGKSIERQLKAVK